MTALVIIISSVAVTAVVTNPKMYDLFDKAKSKEKN